VEDTLHDALKVQSSLPPLSRAVELTTLHYIIHMMVHRTPF